jgi:hypothetical protein
MASIREGDSVKRWSRAARNGRDDVLITYCIAKAYVMIVVSKGRAARKKVQFADFCT